jgi:hypothetical protein
VVRLERLELLDLCARALPERFWSSCPYRPLHWAGQSFIVRRDG